MDPILSKVHGQGQVNIGHRMIMQNESHKTHFYASLGTHNSMMTFIFIFDQRKSQRRVKMRQISKFKIPFKITVKVSAKVYPLSYPLLFQDSKKYILSYVNQIFKIDVICFTWFFEHFTAKNKNSRRLLYRHLCDTQQRHRHKTLRSQTPFSWIGLHKIYSAYR